MFAKSKVTQSMLDAVNSVLAEDEKKRLINDAEMDETGFHKAAHAAKKSGQSHFEFQGKKYPVTAKSHKEAIEMDEANSEKVKTATGMVVYGHRYGNAAKARKDQTKSSVDDIHKGPSKSDIEKTGKDDDLEYKRTTPSMKKQYATHAGKYFSAMDKGDHRKTDKEAPRYKNEEYTFATKLLNHITENKAAHPQEVFTDNNLGEEEMTDKQKAKREKIVLSMKKGEGGFKQRYGKNWKNVMYATATKQAMKEDASDAWNGSYDFVISEQEIELDEGEINELNKATLGSYIKKASSDRATRNFNQGLNIGTSNYDDTDNRKDFNRRKGIHQAVNRLTSEETEYELEEGDAQYKKMDPKKPFKKMSDVVDRKKTVKDLMKGRQYFGTGKVKEEVEQIDELGDATLSSYVGKAYKDQGTRMAVAGGLAGLHMAKTGSKPTKKQITKMMGKDEIRKDKNRDAGVHGALSRLSKTHEFSKHELGNDSEKLNSTNYKGHKVEGHSSWQGTSDIINHHGHINGKKFHVVNHPNYLKFKTQHTPDEKQAIIHNLKKNDMIHKWHPDFKMKEEVELNEDESLDSIAKKHGMEYKKTTYGAGMKHKTKGEISINRYGEWHHYPAGSKSSKAHGGSDNNFASLDKHLSSLKEEVEIEESVATTQDKSANKITTDTLNGREPGGKLNSFKNFKVNLVTSGEEDIPKDVDEGEDTKEKQKITTNTGPVDIKMDDKYGSPTPQSHYATQDKITKEEVELTEGALEKFLSQKGIEMKNLSYSSKIAYSKSNEFIKWKQNHQMEETDPPFEKPYKTVPKDVTDKSGATHTPMSRARDLARNAMKKVKKETMMGKISN